jgi:hypothetical protein
VIFTDDQGGLLLSYCLCHKPVVGLVPPSQHFFEGRCGTFRAVSLDYQLWTFRAPTFSSELEALSRTYGLAPGQTIWVFQAGWLVDKEPDLRAGSKYPHETGAFLRLRGSLLQGSRFTARCGEPNSRPQSDNSRLVWCSRSSRKPARTNRLQGPPGQARESPALNSCLRPERCHR